MKKHVIIATGLAVLSTSAYASKARMSALGQDAAYGSHYIQDTRNVFRNAAHVNTHTDYAIFEWGNTNYAFTDDAESTEDGMIAEGAYAEGGFFRSHGAFNYGVYLGNTIGMFDVNDWTGGDFKEKQDALDLFFGGDTGAIQWGANLHWASSKNEGVGAGAHDVEHSALGIGLGMTMGDIEAYFNYRFKDDHEGAGNNNDEFERSLMLVGGSYSLGNLTFFASYLKADADWTEAGVAEEEVTRTTLELGVGHTHEVSATSRLFANVSYVADKLELVEVSASPNVTEEVKVNRLPIVIGYEADANSWLTLRGSVAQNIIVGSVELTDSTPGEDDEKMALENSTTVSAGATLNFGSLKVDGMIGTQAAGQLSLGDNVMSQVAVHYWF